MANVTSNALLQISHLEGINSMPLCFCDWNFFYQLVNLFFLSEVKIMRWLIGGLLLLGAVVRSEDEVEGEDGVQFEDDTIYRAVIESCSG